MKESSLKISYEEAKQLYEFMTLFWKRDSKKGFYKIITIIKKDKDYWELSK